MYVYVTIKSLIEDTLVQVSGFEKVSFWPKKKVSFGVASSIRVVFLQSLSPPLTPHPLSPLSPSVTPSHPLSPPLTLSHPPLTLTLSHTYLLVYGPHAILDARA